jgi:hypothetical protein
MFPKCSLNGQVAPLSRRAPLSVRAVESKEETTTPAFDAEDIVKTLQDKVRFCFLRRLIPLANIWGLIESSVELYGTIRIIYGTSGIQGNF